MPSDETVKDGVVAEVVKPEHSFLTDWLEVPMAATEPQASSKFLDQPSLMVMVPQMESRNSDR